MACSQDTPRIFQSLLLLPAAYTQQSITFPIIHPSAPVCVAALRSGSDIHTGTVLYRSDTRHPVPGSAVHSWMPDSGLQVPHDQFCLPLSDLQRKRQFFQFYRISHCKQNRFCRCFVFSIFMFLYSCISNSVFGHTVI